MTADRAGFVEQMVDLAGAARALGLPADADRVDAARRAYLEAVRTYEVAETEAAALAAAGRAAQAVQRLTAAKRTWTLARHKLDRVVESVIEAVGAAAPVLGVESHASDQSPAPPSAPPAEQHPSWELIEEARRELARQGRAHGYGALSAKSGPFPGQRTTIRRRYESRSLPPPGSPVEGICETAPTHQHHRGVDEEH